MTLHLRKWTLTLALLLSAVVILLGGYTRLVDAGLGCPDWPGCYGQWFVPVSNADQISAQENFPAYPLEVNKAYPEMIHRYVAGTLGLMIAGLGLSAWITRRDRLYATALMGLVIFQALLGKWTVTWRLFPPVVMGHLLGGTLLISLLSLWRLKYTKHYPPVMHPSLHRWTIFTITLVVIQIALGGWTSANYAALACPDFPTCFGHWLPAFSSHGFDLTAGWQEAFPPAAKTFADRISIQMIHRLGALIVTLALIRLIIMLYASRALRRWAIVFSGILCLQLTLGILNVRWFLPLPIALCHQAGAIVLLLTLLRLRQRIFQ